MRALSIVTAMGVWDDVAEISPRIKFAIQIVASSLMIWGAGVQLNSVGDLLGWRPIGLLAQPGWTGKLRRPDGVSTRRTRPQRPGIRV